MAKKKVDYSESVENWVNSATRMEERKLDLKKFSKMSKQKILNTYKGGLPEKNKEGYYVISQRKKYIELYLYYDDPERYYHDMYVFIDRLKYPILHKRYKEDYIQFKYPQDNKLYSMSLIHFTYNFIMWLPLFALGEDINKDNTFSAPVFNNKNYINFINTKIINPNKHKTTHNEMSKMLARMYDLFVLISEKYALGLGLSFSIHDLIQKWDNKEIYDLNHTQISPDMRINEAEDFLTKQVKKYIDIMLNEPDKDNILKPFLRSGTGIDIKQLKECCINIGYKPDLNGDTYTMRPTSNLITDGIRDPINYVIDAMGGRKAAALALYIADGGYMARTMEKVAIDITLDPDPNSDCGSENYYERKIENNDDLKFLRGRWYLTKKNTLRQLIETDYDLIGKTLKFRTPVTCAGKNGICSICYGHLHNQNVGINAGLNSAIKISERNYQNSMSAKHILSTNTLSVNFDNVFDEYFEIKDGYRIAFKEDSDVTDNYEIWINKNMVQRDEDVDELEHNEYTSEFILYNPDTDEKIEIKDEESRISLYLANQIFFSYLTKKKHNEFDEEGWIKISVSELSMSEDIMFMKLKNSEITRSLKELKAWVEKGKVVEASNISELINTIRKYMNHGGIYLESVHMEILVRNLVRDANNPINLPDWSIKDPNYTITSIHNSIMMNNSIINSVTFERLKSQLKDPISYNKTGVSVYDRLFLFK